MTQSGLLLGVGIFLALPCVILGVFLIKELIKVLCCVEVWGVSYLNYLVFSSEASKK